MPTKTLSGFGAGTSLIRYNPLDSTQSGSGTRSPQCGGAARTTLAFLAFSQSIDDVDEETNERDSEDRGE